MKKDLHNIVESTINSLDNIQRAEAPAFFATRMNARLDKHLEPKGFVLPLRRPALVLAILLFFLVVNIVMLTAVNNKTSVGSSTENNTATLQNFANEYGLNTSTGY
ncbi:MAG: hypothetical protein C0459_01500 [Chitinophaga sp.]|jgi:hypothetical protein|nr:hypothetical protein [Chitinophaga sp.]